MLDYYVLIAIVAYLCGSVPFGYTLVRMFMGKDVRESGSGNIGATNVARVAPGLGIATLLLDAGKGFLPVWIVRDQAMAMGDAGKFHELEVSLALAAFFAVLGHVAPVWLKFRGGKGVATACGAYLALAPLMLALAFIVFALTLAAFRYVSLASIAAAIVFPMLLHTLSYPELRSGPLLTSTIAISVLVIAKHHANIRRLLNGTENRFGKKRAAEQIAAED